MTTPLSSDLANTLEGGPAQQIAQHLGITPSQASAAIGAALPLLLGALGRNASQPQGAQSLYGALQRDHSGQDVGNVLGSVLGGGGQGSQILGHVFGDRTPRAEQAVGQTTGIGQDKAHVLLRWLAPIAMAYVAKRMFDRRQAAASDASTAPSAAAPASPQVLSDVLGQEAEHAQRQSGGLLGAVLDRNGDGTVDFSDLLKAGGSVLGGLGQQPSHRL
ncbi:DUF937 domain-containing protein [Cognatiluteimonas profundi]|uniref:DUF937 domain-containing protein n=1 Tax=Cognatiluteimonas profundi TaxID=2594501 RepID=UPI00131AA257|nr:DUF937 domain-containing protein [Lysobacter profundi]